MRLQLRFASKRGFSRCCGACWAEETPRPATNVLVQCDAIAKEQFMRSKILQGIGIGALAFALAACSTPGGTPQGEPTNGSPTKVTKIAVGGNTNSMNLPVWVGIKEGIFK